MGTEGKSVVQMQVAKQQGVVLEAANMTAEQIANLCNVSVPSVKRWRRDPEYQAAVQEAAARHMEDLHPVIEAMKNEMIGAARKGTGVLVAAMEKTDADGFPHRNAIDAARTAVGNARFAAGEAREDSAGGGNTAVIVVESGQLERGREEPRDDDLPGDAVEIPT